jgi:pyruvate,orthophosphate dikinase
MIEIPRAALTADEIAEVAEFFSFGTNDLTQMTFGYSRDDVKRASCPTTSSRSILPVDPFQSLDQTGVGQLVEMGVEKGRATNARSSSASAASTAATRSVVDFCHTSGSTTSAARPSACRSPASRRPRPRQGGDRSCPS